MAAAAMDAALASLRSAMESLLEEKLAAALAEMEVLRADTSQLKLEQQALEKVASELRTENLRLRAEINEVRLRVGGVEAASTAPGSPARPDSTSPSSSEKDWDGADGSVRLPLSLRKAWYRNAVERVLSLELEAEQATKPSATGLEALEAKTETEDLWANWKPSGRDGRDRRQWLEDIVNRAVQVRATSVVHLRWEPTRDSMKNGSKLHEGAMAWSDAQVQVQGVTHYRLQSGWAPLLRQKGQNILEEVDWDTDWSKDSDRGWDWKGTNGYGGYGPQKQAWSWKEEDCYGRAGRAWGNWRGG